MSSQSTAVAPCRVTSPSSAPVLERWNRRGPSPESLCVQNVPSRERARPESSVGPTAWPSTRTLRSPHRAGGRGVAVAVGVRGALGSLPPQPASRTLAASAVRPARANREQRLLLRDGDGAGDNADQRSRAAVL